MGEFYTGFSTFITKKEREAMKKYAGFDDIPADEKAAFILAAEAAQSKEELEALKKLIKARCRKAAKAASDRKQRILIGIRVPKAKAEEIRAAARRKNQTLYKFVQTAIYQAAKIPIIQKNDVQTEKENGERLSE